MYTPPKRINSNSTANAIDNSPVKKEGKPLFKLEYTSVDGASHTILVGTIFRDKFQDFYWRRGVTAHLQN